MIRQLNQVRWETIPGYNGLYLLSEMGNVYNTKSRRFIAPLRSGIGRTFTKITLYTNGVGTTLGVNKLIEQIYGNT